MSFLTLVENDALLIELLVLRHVPSALKGCGFAFIADNEPCKRLFATIKRAVRHVSKLDAIRIATTLSRDDNTKSKRDLISIYVEEQKILHSTALSEFAMGIYLENVELNPGLSKISCEQAMDNTFDLGSIYERAIVAINQQERPKPKSTKFQRKHKNRPKREPWPMEGIRAELENKRNSEDNK